MTYTYIPCLKTSNLIPTTFQPQKPCTHIIHHLLRMTQPSNSTQNTKFPNCLEKPSSFIIFQFFLTIPTPLTKHQNFQHKIAMKSSPQTLVSWSFHQIPKILHTYFEKYHSAPKSSLKSPIRLMSQKSESVTISHHLPSTSTPK